MKRKAPTSFRRILVLAGWRDVTVNNLSEAPTSFRNPKLSFTFIFLTLISLSNLSATRECLIKKIIGLFAFSVIDWMSN